RRHTSSYGDWSSDVCSSDLITPRVSAASPGHGPPARGPGSELAAPPARPAGPPSNLPPTPRRAPPHPARVNSLARPGGVAYAGKIGRASWRARVESWGWAGE